MATQERKIPAPEANPETRPFWEAAAAGRLLIGKCKTCGKPHYYPRAICPLCGT
ncbi:MAG TPA: zinc ribbon domain-containing protein, partial [Methylomirabilota bacterium]